MILKASQITRHTETYYFFSGGRTMHTRFVLMAVILFIIHGFVPVVFADEPVSREELLQMQREMAELKELIGEMKTIITEQQKMIHELQGHAAEEPEVPHIASTEKEDHTPGDVHDGRKKDLHAVLSEIKPSITIAGDFVANLSDDSHMRTEDDRFDLRGVDILFSGGIDDTAKALVNLAYHDEDVVLEEAYLDVYRFLPFGTDLRLGKYRLNFGILNTVHPHGLPQVDYPAVYREYLGHEGYIDEGIGISGRVPSLWGSPFEYSLQAVNGNRHEHGHDDDHAEDDHDEELYRRMKDFDDIVYVGRLSNTLTPADSMAIRWGLSGLTGKFEDEDESPRYYLTGAELTLNWHPFKEEFKRVRWQSEAFSSAIEDHSDWEHAYGVYSFLDYRFLPAWILGVRYDYVQLPLDSNDHRTEYSAYLTHKYTENNQLRLQVKRSQRNYEKDTNEIMLQWVFMLGRHVH